MENVKERTIEKREPKETKAYRCYRRYQEHFFVNSNLEKVLKQCRDFYNGKQYRLDTANDMPKPVFNICREGVDKLSAKILETEFAVRFYTDAEGIDLTSVDNFYEYQMNVCDNDEIISRMGKNGFRDGMSVVITGYDEDTIGTESLFRGFLKKEILPFEQCFFDNPYAEDIQNNRYLGYTLFMEVRAVKSLIEGNDNRKKEVGENVVPEDFFSNSSIYEGKTADDIGSETVPVYVRFFRVDGEVMFEMATKYAEIYEFPHALNPRLNASIGRNLVKGKKSEYREGDMDSYDYDMDAGKYLIFQKAVRTSKKEYKKRKGKFYLYPMELFRPYPIDQSVLGTSAVQLMLANQKLINLIFLYVALIMQYHAMPKWIAKEDALRGQQIDNSPNQVIKDFTPVTAGVQWGVQRMGGGDAVNSNLIEIGTNIIGLTQNLNGFADLVSDGDNSKMSGFAYQQVVHQSNLILQQPQKRLWKSIEHMAKIDMMYFKHYVDNAKFYTRKTEARVQRDEAYKNMAQQMVNAGSDPSIPAGTTLPDVQSVEVNNIKSEMFDSDFGVECYVEQGVASSLISESEQYNQIWQYIFSANVNMDQLKVYVAGSETMSAKTKQKVYDAIEAVEVSQMAIKDQQIQQLTAEVEQLQGYLKTAKSNIDFLNQRDQARNKAFDQATKEQAAMVKMIQDRAAGQAQMSEGEVKAQNAKGVSGGSFTQGGAL